MKKTLLTTFALSAAIGVSAQDNPVIKAWLQNNTIKGSHYVQGNSTAIEDDVLANVQKVQYSSTNVYITTNGIPAYPTGPFLDGNRFLAEDQNAIFKFPLNPSKNNGTPTETGLGNIGVFINGTALFNFADGVSYSLNDRADKGGPLGGRGDGVWNRDAVLAEMAGFDCSKGHPANGNYHHHQNPSAFKLDKNVVSTICNLYDADGLYTIDASTHSPLIGYAYDGYPIYGAYGYDNTDGTGGITRIKTSYKLRNITQRTEYADETDVTDGPAVNTTYPLGYYKEDYEYVANHGHLDEHNGRFCVTPEYPNGTYAYFATVDADWNSEYPYAVGLSFYGNYANRKVTSVTEQVTDYNAVGIESNSAIKLDFNVFPNPAHDFIAVQANGLVRENIKLELISTKGDIVRESTLKQGTTIWYIDTKTLYNGQYFLRINDGDNVEVKKVVLNK